MDSLSQQLQKLLANKHPMTLQTLANNFGEKSFAILLLLLLAVPALPLPTGGITHIFEIIAMLIAIELIAGLKTVWLPKRWRDKTLPKVLRNSALPRFIKTIQWVEKYSIPRLSRIQTNKAYKKLIGLLVLLFTIFAFVAPPFSGLDTLPSLGVVLLSLALILEDALLAVIGIVIGGVGIALVIFIGGVVFQLL